MQACVGHCFQTPPGPPPPPFPSRCGLLQPPALPLLECHRAFAPLILLPGSLSPPSCAWVILQPGQNPPLAFQHHGPVLLPQVLLFMGFCVSFTEECKDHPPLSQLSLVEWSSGWMDKRV